MVSQDVVQMATGDGIHTTAKLTEISEADDN
jgi:hypothetical protein